MKYVLISLLLLSRTSGAQEPLTYSIVLQVDSLGKNEIYDKSLIWCAKVFNDSKSAIKVQEREGGIVSGKAAYRSSYRVPKKKDSVWGTVFTTYHFDWLIEIKDNKIRFSINGIMYDFSDSQYAVTTEKKPPIGIMFQSKEKNELEWKLAKEYLLSNLDKLAHSLHLDINRKKDDF